MKIRIENRIIEINNELANRFEKNFHEKINDSYIKMCIEDCTKKEYTQDLLSHITDKELTEMVEYILHLELFEDVDNTFLNKWQI